MFRLTRQVRFAIGSGDTADTGQNGWSGMPELTGFARFFALDVTVAGGLDPATQYLVNIKSIDAAVRQRVVPIMAGAVNGFGASQPAGLLSAIHAALVGELAPARLDVLRLWSSPYQSVVLRTGEIPMVRFTQQFEFAASHRLHNPSLTDEQNRLAFGKCNNPLGHGHNYVVEVAMIGTPDDAGRMIDQPAMQSAVARVIDRFDHRHLNHELPEFKDRIPTVENIAKVIYGLLKEPLNGSTPSASSGQASSPRAKLASVTVWETPKTSCEYFEPS
jgi:6-pyruvoyltetrahydropterin/6-carboxytetrahydropterin synthase